MTQEPMQNIMCVLSFRNVEFILAKNAATIWFRGFGTICNIIIDK